jgi:hypothetical protein
VARADLDGPIVAAWRALVRRGWRIRVWLAITTIAGIVLATLPLFGVLGFELALASSLFAAIAAIDLGAALARAAQRAPAAPLVVAAPPLRLVAELAVRAIAIGVVVALPPAIVATVHGIWTVTCDWAFGVEAYVALPIASAVVFAGAGVAVGLVTGPRRAIGNIVPYVVVLVVAGWGLWRFYAEPPVFSYNPIIGFFPGNLYDEDVSIGWPLVWSRIEQIAFVVGLLGLCAARLDAPRMRVGWRAMRPNGLRLPAWIAAVAGLAIAVVIRLFGGTLGHAIDADDIVDELGARKETAHFVIHYAHGEVLDGEIDLIAADHELRLAQVVARLGVAPSGKIHSYYFTTREQKARWMGARDVEMAKPWRREIYLDHRAFPHSSLRHEIIHVVAGEFGDPLFAVSSRRILGLPLLANPGLIEGLAVATDWPGVDWTLTPHELVRTMQAMGVEPSVDSLLSLRFLSLSSARGYTTAGSFLRFLLDRYGAAPIRVLYESGGDFIKAYGRSQRELAAEWRTFLAAIVIPPSEVKSHEERFRRGSVFERPCPHAIAKRRNKAIDRARDGDRGGAIGLLRRICKDDPGEPRYLLDLASMLAEGSPAERDEARAIWRRLADDESQTTAIRSSALVDLADDAAASGDWTAVRALVERAVALSVDDNTRRQHQARKFGLDHGGPAAAALRSYFFGLPGDVTPPLARAEAAVAAEPELGIAHYLVGLQKIEARDWAGATAALRTALSLTLPGPLFVRNGARRLAIAAFRAGDLGGVEAAIAVLADPSMSAVDHLLADDWRERVAFTRTGRL